MDNTGFGSRTADQSNIVAPWRFTILAGMVFSGLLVIYFGLSFGYQNFLEKSISNTQSKTDDINKNSIDVKSRDQFLSFYSRSVNVQKLLNSHITIRPVFNILESRTLPGVYYSDSKIDVSEKIISLTGFAKDFETLANQIYIYSNTSGLSKVGVSDTKVSEKGLSFNPKVILESSVFVYKNLGLGGTTQTLQ